MQMSMRNGVTPKLKLTLTLTDTEDAVLTLMLGHRSLYITWQQHHNCRIVCELSLRILICILPKVPQLSFLPKPNGGLMKCSSSRRKNTFNLVNKHFTIAISNGMIQSGTKQKSCFRERSVRYLEAGSTFSQVSK